MTPKRQAILSAILGVRSYSGVVLRVGNGFGSRVVLFFFCFERHFPWSLCICALSLFSLGCDERIYHYAICAMNDQRCVSFATACSASFVMCSSVTYIVDREPTYHMISTSGI